MRRVLKLLLYLLTAGFTVFVFAVIATIGAYFYVADDLPEVETLREIQLQVPLRVYTRDGRLMAEFGEKRRVPVTWEDIPEPMVDAFLAAEDDRFFEHPGVDYQGILRAAFNLLVTGEKTQGGSTITMQLARNFFLSREKTYIRKLSEIFLALKIERELSKQEVLTLYLNKIYLGNRAYGVGAAAEVYYGRTVDRLDLAQVAMIAGLPKAPSSFNPLANPERARERRSYVLRRMEELGYIGPGERERTDAEPLTAEFHGQVVQVSAPYVAEMVRSEMVERYGPSAYTAGYRVVTTIDSRLQPAAVSAVRAGLEAYDRRHGWRGAVTTVDVPVLGESDGDRPPEEAAAQWEVAVKDVPSVADLVPAVVIRLEERSAIAHARGRGRVEIPWEGMQWARPFVDRNTLGDPPEKAGDILSHGDVVYLREGAAGWNLVQVPEVQGALVSLDPVDGAVTALTGGYNFTASKFNRVTQAERQPGSAFKPFVYGTALAHGFTPATVVNDAPVVFADEALENVWRPENYSQRFFGPTRLREALYKSRNLVSIRVLRETGIANARDYMPRFGFDREKLPDDLSLALGSLSLTPMELARGFTVLANGGHLVAPYVIDRIEDGDGRVIHAANPPVVCEACAEAWKGQPLNDPEPYRLSSGTDALAWQTPAVPLAGRTIPEQDAYLMVDMMQDVVKRGTGRRALALGRDDLAGKTGTANDFRDAWFSGFNRELVATAWIGFDQPASLGRGEAGATAALPIWIDYMGAALAGVAESRMERPDGLVTVRIDPETGLRARAGNPDAIFETFRDGNVPELEPPLDEGRSAKPGDEEDEEKAEDLF